MQRIFEFLGFAASGEAQAPSTAAVRRIVEALEALDGDRARFLAAFAYLLGRVAHADLEISAEETRQIEEVLRRYGELPDQQARLVVEIVQAEHDLDGGTQNFQVAREFRQVSTRDERRELLHCLFAVSAADETISGVEEKHISQIAEELGFSPREYLEVRSAYNDKRSVIRLARGR